MADEISDLRLFAQMVAAGSLSETARRLKSSLPAMSRRLAAMERRLGARLITRGARRFTLTEEGAMLHERGLAILEDINQIESEVGARTLAPRGHIKVAAPLEIGRRRIAPLIGDFRQKYPEVSVELVLSDSPADVIANGLDVALHTDDSRDGETVSRLLIPSRRVLCAAPSYIARRGRPARLQDLPLHECITLVRGNHVYDYWTFAKGGEVESIQVHGGLSTSSSEVLHEWVLAGYGVGPKARWDIEENLADGSLVDLFPDHVLDPISLYVIYPTRAHLPSRVRFFVEFVAAALKAPPPQRAISEGPST